MAHVEYPVCILTTKSAGNPEVVETLEAWNEVSSFCECRGCDVDHVCRCLSLGPRHVEADVVT